MEAFHLKRKSPVESLLRKERNHSSGCSRYRATTTNDLRQCNKSPTSASSARTSGNRRHTIQLCRHVCRTLYFRHNLCCIMMTMLFVLSIVLTGNSALAAQRESFKPKDTNSINNNNPNTILNEIGSSSSGGSSSNGNGNAVSHSNANNISNGNSNVNNNIIGTAAINTHKTTTSLTTTTTSTSSSAINSNSGGYATTTSTHTTSSTSSSSSSGHKSTSFNRNSIETSEPTQNGPYFDKAASKNITALLGKTAYLNCRVKNLGNKTMLLQVSWVRHRDIHLLTVGRYTYTSDQRFRAIHQPQTEDWILQIKYPQHRDSGIYECQVSTTPHMSHYIHLNVVEPSTEIIGAPDLYIESGSTINLTCVILNSPEPPAYIFWNHNNAIINYDSPRGGVSVVTNKGETTTSFLLIKSARPSDSGHYQCNPSNAKHKSVTVHVLNGVSHSVSRGIPSSNAARGTGTSSNVSKSLYLSVPVNVLVYLSICQALHKAAVCNAWYKFYGHVIETCTQTISLLQLLLVAIAIQVLGEKKKIKTTTTVTKVVTTKKLQQKNNDNNNNDNTACCYYMQLRENNHMPHTAATATKIFIIINSRNASLVSTMCCYDEHQSVSKSVSAASTFASSTSCYSSLNIWRNLLYSKEFHLFRNASAALLTTTSSSSSSPLPSLINNSPSSLCCRWCYQQHRLATQCLCLQSTSTFFSESDIR